MKKSILNLEGAKMLTRDEQKLLGGASINIRCPKKCCEWIEDANGNPTSQCSIWSFCIGTNIYVCP